METARSKKYLLYSCYQAFFHWERIRTFSGGKKKNSRCYEFEISDFLFLFLFFITVRIHIAYLYIMLITCCCQLCFFFLKNSLCIFYHFQWHFLPKSCSQEGKNMLLLYEVLFWVQTFFTSHDAGRAAEAISNWFSLNVWKIEGEKCFMSGTLGFTGSYHFILLCIKNVLEWNKPKKSNNENSTFKLGEFN